MSGVAVRDYRPDDETAVLDLMAAALGWQARDAQQELFRWKHHESPFGISPGWVAVDGEQVVGFRTFMRWEFLSGGQVVRAARAVDTATHPDHQGRGIFRRLTLHALEALRADGTSFVFNTPNDNSRPGYLKMGWEPVGRLPLAVRVRTPRSAARLALARVPAERWSLPCSVGQPAPEALRQPGLDRLLASPGEEGLRTRRTRDFLLWRYGFSRLEYRALLLGPAVEDGVALFRLRRRGPATEAVLADVLLPPGARAPGAARRVVRETGADYAVALRPAPPRMVPLPDRLGPLLVWRSVLATEAPPLADWRLVLGDVELF